MSNRGKIFVTDVDGFAGHGQFIERVYDAHLLRAAEFDPLAAARISDRRLTVGRSFWPVVRSGYQLSQCVNFWTGSRYACLRSSRCGYAMAISAACPHAGWRMIRREARSELRLDAVAAPARTELPAGPRRRWY
jgi:hypothetical protein